MSSLRSVTAVRSRSRLARSLLLFVSLPLALTLTLTLTGCGPGGAPPRLDPVGDQLAYVGLEFALELYATDAEDAPLSYAYSTTLPDLAGRAELRRYGDGSRAVFRFTPRGADVGVWTFDFTVSDGGNEVTETVTIEVRSSIGEGGLPLFRRPLGQGTTLDLAVSACVDLDILVEDSDSGEVTIAEDEPRIEGTQFQTTGPFTATWRFCPTAAQASAENRYELLLSASDDVNPRTVKRYLIVLRTDPLRACAGDGPVIDHAPADENTLNGLTPYALIADDLGLKSDPLFYYSTTAPGPNPNLSAMTQLTMILISGDMRDGLWAADVPNPVVGTPTGTAVELFYVIVAEDNDDADGACDHVTESPMSGAHAMRVTNPGGSGGLPHCSRCTADVQCGDELDLCVRLGSGDDHFCFTSCASDTECPIDTYCSFSTLTSVDGGRGRQCIPEDYSCGPPPTALCVDDDYEENDSRTAATLSAVLPPGFYDLVSCPASGGGGGDDEDWFELDLPTAAQVTAVLEGGATTDLDLTLADAFGAVLMRSESFTSSERIAGCLGAGRYYLRIRAAGSGENAYLLEWTRTATSSCGSCEEDTREPDDGASTARAVELDFGSPYHTYSNAICADDDDWFGVLLYSGERVQVSLEFLQTSASEDLDLHFYSGSTDLTPCSPGDVAECDASNGQGANSNENMTYTVSATGTYYVVVRGWNGGENLYDLCIGLAAADCPRLP